MKPIIIPFLFSALIAAGCGGRDGTTITETGTLEAREVTVSSQVNGTVARLPIDEGSLVKQGDTLAVLDDADWRYQLQQGEANFRAADASYQLALEGPRQEDVVQAEAAYASAKSDLQRMENLFASKSVPEKQLEDARTRYTLAQQTLEKMKRGSRKEEVALARARRDQAAAQVASLQKKVDDCTIAAPIEGTVTNKFVEAGELALPGMPIVRLANLDDMDVTIYVSEVDLPHIAIGQQATVSVDAYKDRSFVGQVIFISPTAEFTPKNIQTREERTKLVFAVKIRVSNPDHVLKGGIPADVTLKVPTE